MAFGSALLNVGIVDWPGPTARQGHVCRSGRTTNERLGPLLSASASSPRGGCAAPLPAHERRTWDAPSMGLASTTRARDHGSIERTEQADRCVRVGEPPRSACQRSPSTANVLPSGSLNQAILCRHWRGRDALLRWSRSRSRSRARPRSARRPRRSTSACRRRPRRRRRTRSRGLRVDRPAWSGDG